MEGWRADLRQAWRALRATPRPVLAAVACIALGVGSSAFVFALADSVLLQRLPFADAERLLRVWTVQEATGRTGSLSYLDVRDLSERVAAFDRWEVSARTRMALTAGDVTERVRGESVTPGYFELTGVRPQIGRVFTADEYAPTAEGVIVIGDALWKRRFGGAPDVLGRSVVARGTTRDGDRSYEIVGVLPPGFAGSVDDDVSEVWLPLEHYQPRMMFDMREARMLWVLARLRPGVGQADAAREVEAAGRALAAEYPDAYAGLRLATEPVGEYWRSRLRAGLSLLAVGAGLLLLIACSNVANLLLARQLDREGVIALRVALGAGQGRLVRQALLESGLIAAVGSAAGAAVAWWGSALVGRAGLLVLPVYASVAPSARVLGAAALLALSSCLLFGALPAVLATRVDPARRLREGGRGTGARRGGRIADALVVSEVALTFALVVAAALLVRSYGHLRGGDIGLRTEGIARLAVSLDPSEYPDRSARLAFVQEARTTLSAQPGVRDVSIISGVLPPWFDREVPVAIDGRPVPALALTELHSVDERFDDVMDLRLLEGRFIEARDGPDASGVVVVSASVARAATGGGDLREVLGRSLQIVTDVATGETGPSLEIVGVVDDVRYHGPLEERPVPLDIYASLGQETGTVLSVAVHAEREPAALLEPLRRELSRLAPTSPLHWTSTMEEELALQLAHVRFQVWMSGAFGASGLLLALLGVYGVLTHVVARRTDEVGIRMALGADRGSVLRLVIGRGTSTVAIGVVTGVALALAGAGLMSGLVHGVAPTDPVTFAAVAVGFLGVAAAVCWLPARRASRVDPARLLRG